LAAARAGGARKRSFFDDLGSGGGVDDGRNSSGGGSVVAGSSLPRAQQKQKSHGFDHDLQLVLPVPVGDQQPAAREYSTNSAPRSRISVRRCSTLSTLSVADSVTSETTPGFPFGIESPEDAAGASDAEGPECEPASNVRYMNFFAHASILSARWPMLASLINQKLERAQTEYEVDSEPRYSASGDLYIRLPDHMAHRPLVWFAFIEYLYTDSIRVHALPLREDACVAAELADLALRSGTVKHHRRRKAVVA
jgi:hypothetical protein